MEYSTVSDIDKLKEYAMTVRSNSLPSQFHTKNFLKGLVDDNLLSFILANPRLPEVRTLAWECHVVACKRVKCSPLPKVSSMIYTKFAEIVQAEYNRRIKEKIKLI